MKGPKAHKSANWCLYRVFTYKTPVLVDAYRRKADANRDKGYLTQVTGDLYEVLPKGKKCVCLDMRG
ncbi:MAG: hypothetical protein PHO00_01005 [bacterium]|nr:hypothetical protein [bacterium]